MPPLLRTLAARFVQTAATAAAATATLLTVAGWADGHLPDPRRLAAVAVPAAAYLGAAWTFAAWRGEGGDVALAALGRRPALAWIPLLLLALPLLALTPGARAEVAGARLSATATGLTVDGPRGFEITWVAGVARRSDTGDTFPALPAPRALAPEPAPTARPWPLLARVVLLVALLAGLAVGGAPPGLPLTLAAAGTALTLGHLAERLA